MTEPTIMRGDIWWVSLDPTQGSEIKKTRPCVVLSHNTINRLRRTVVVVPLSTAAKSHPPITVPVNCQGGAAVAVEKISRMLHRRPPQGRFREQLFWLVDIIYALIDPRVRY